MRDAIMPDIPIHNETDYDLLPWMIHIPPNYVVIPLSHSSKAA